MAKKKMSDYEILDNIIKPVGTMEAFLRVLRDGPKNTKEQKVYDNFVKQYKGKQIPALTAAQEKGILFPEQIKAYNYIRSFLQNNILQPISTQTPSQQATLSEDIKQILSQPSTSTQVSAPQAQIQQQVSPIAVNPIVAQTPADIITGNVGQALNLIPEAQAPANATPAQIQRAQRLNLMREQAIQQGPALTNMLAGAMQQGAQPLAPFVSPDASPLLQSYNKLVNAVRPERTTTQRVASALAPYGTQAGSAIGSLAGSAFGPVGTVGGGLLGSLLGLGSQAALNMYAQPSPEFQAIGRLLTGTGPGYLKSGTRGLADLISGRGKGSSLRTLFGLLRKSPSKTTLGKLRSGFGGGIGWLGEQIAAPGAAGKLGALLQAGEALYGLGQNLGLIGKRNQSLQGLGLTGQDLAALSLPSAYQFAVPELQRINNQFYRRPLPISSSTRGLDQRLYGALAPLMAGQNIAASELGSKQQAANLSRAGVTSGAQTQAALNALREQAQSQNIANQAANLGLQQREQLFRAQTGAQRGRLSKEELLAGLPTQIPSKIERVQQQPGVPEAFGALAAQTAPIAGQAAGQAIFNALNVPQQVNPVMTSAQPTLSSTDYDLSLT